MVFPTVVAAWTGLALTGFAWADGEQPTDEAKVQAVTAPTDDFTKAEAFEANSGGGATVARSTADDAFSLPASLLTETARMDFALGNALFRKLWIAAPASTKASDGLGPFYNARSCEACHRRDGRGHLPEAKDRNAISALLRLSVTGGPAPMGIEGWNPTSPHPRFGGQLQDFAAPGLAVEGALHLRYEEITEYLQDGTKVQLRRPLPSLQTKEGLIDDPVLMTSLRIAPQMIGLGLLEAIPESQILANADPDDADGDGISGRAQIVPSVETGKPTLGRFGWKAGAPSLREQSAAAFSADMGLSTPLFPQPWGDCTEEQAQCRAAPNGQEPGIRDGLEVDAKALDIMTHYTRVLGVPARARVDDPVILQGKVAFYALGCTACHRPKFVTARNADAPEADFQLIWPYSDLLLHDMGEGLADNRPEGRASGREWRTPPLWGIGLTQQVSGRMSLLHDGRARSFAEAILWHGGEASAAKIAFAALPAADRAALIAFLESL